MGLSIYHKARLLHTAACIDSLFLSPHLQTNVNWPNVHSINLTLFNVSWEDNSFQLTCIAENVVGITNSTVLLSVQCECPPAHTHTFYWRVKLYSTCSFESISLGS